MRVATEGGHRAHQPRAARAGQNRGRDARPWRVGRASHGGDCVSHHSQSEPPLLEKELRELKLPSFAENWSAIADEAKRRGTSYPEYLAELTHLEITGRYDRRVGRRIKEAKFPSLKTVDAFDFERQPGVDRDKILELARADFVERHENIVLLGEIGTGKTHLASAIGFACCQRGYRVRFMTAADLTTVLVESKSVDRLSRKLDQMARYDVVILDELGYVPFDRAGADLLFTFITRVYEQRSLIVTTNLPFARWTEVFQDATAAAAVIDRIVHHATILTTTGRSYRLQAAQDAQAANAARDEK
ncbi:MAG TPA: AAA family ATPase [Polyangiaceae bacterium]|nr:AAA family ATPase [Polyangiaceae bacterium]